MRGAEGEEGREIRAQVRNCMLSPTYTQNKSFEKRRTTIVNFFPNAPMRIPLKMLDSLNLHSVSLIFLGRWPSLLEFFFCVLAIAAFLSARK